LGFKGQYIKAGAMMNLFTDICYSPGQNLSSDVLCLALIQSFNFGILGSYDIYRGTFQREL